MAWMPAAAPASFELVLLDPPFDAQLAAPAAAAAARLLVPGGYLYVEAAAPLTELPDGLEAHRQSRAGAVSFQLLRRRYTPPVAP
jgi:16S rRNA G966 N2-methylase RsmD